MVVLSGPSAVGKSTVVRCLRDRIPDLHFSVSVTTRAPRPGEVDGVDYTFVSAEEFQWLIDEGELLEWADIHGGLHRSGTPAAPVRSASASRPSRRSVIAGRIVTGIIALLLTLDVGAKLVRAQAVVDGSAKLGFTPDQMFVVGVIGAVCLVLYLIPRTAPIGALLWTGYFGGAIVTHLRVGDPLLTHILFPIYVSALLWGGLYLRDPRVRAVLGKR